MRKVLIEFSICPFLHIESITGPAVGKLMRPRKDFIFHLVGVLEFRSCCVGAFRSLAL